VLQSNTIRFVPRLSQERIKAIQSIDFQPGFKLMMKFSEKFYPDVILCDTEVGEKTYYDVAFKKNSKENIFGLPSMGSSAKNYYQLNSEEKIISNVLEELDIIFDGKASKYYTGQYLIEDWGKHQYTLGTWTNDWEKGMLEVLNQPLENKVYFAGETNNINGQESTVQGAIMSGYFSTYKLLKNNKQTGYNNVYK
jgi:monoamine oxidase